MSRGNSLPLLAEGRDEMRLGLGAVKDDKVPAHPVQLIQDNYAAAQHAQKKRMLATSSGVALAMKMDVEERVLARFRRGPGLVSSMAGLETALGLDTDVDFGDYLNDPEFRTHEVDVHVAMEKRQDTEALVAAGRRQ